MLVLFRRILGVFYFHPSNLEIWSILLQFFRPPLSRFYLQLFLIWACFSTSFFKLTLPLQYLIIQIWCVLFKWCPTLGQSIFPVFFMMSTASNASLVSNYPPPTPNIFFISSEDSYVLLTSVSFCMIIISTLLIKF